MPKDRMAELYRMVLPDHTCPYGVRAKELLEQNDFDIEEHILSTREDVEVFKAEYGVEMTPLIFIDGKRIGGNADLERYLAKA
jgi:glutaredoxin 3